MNQHCTTPRPAVKRGFTLVEVLIAIGIIAVLAALLFPVARNVRQGAQRSSCANNLKQLGVAFQQYVQDNGGRYPGAGQLQRWGNGGHWVKGTNNGVTSGTVNNDGMDGALFKIATPDEPTGRTADIEGGALYSYVKSAPTYICPSSPYGEDTRLSYSMNCAIAGMNVNARMKTPGEINLLVDEAYANDGFFYVANSTNSTDALAQNHVKSGNILFCDGHVKSYTYDLYPLSSTAGALKIRQTETPRFLDAAFDATGTSPSTGYYTSSAFGSCAAP
jgi:prepilin-type N-terminal cleavage/methylation domain-containing protein/prepilin-type processing-associated H-X9-DG protein